MAYRTSLFTARREVRAAVQHSFGFHPLCKQQQRRATVAGNLIKQGLVSSSKADAGAGAAGAADVYAVKKLPTPTLSVVGSDRRFPVRRVYCVGSNYRDHVREMGGNPDKAPPFFFTKPPDAAVDVSPHGAAMVNFPTETDDFQHEVEMVVAIGRGGRGISRETALKHVFAYGVGVDLTRRDMQRVAKKAGRPWDCSKGFDSSGPVGALTPASDCAAGAGPGSENRAIWLRVNGGPRQESVLGEMIWSVPEMIARLSELFTLQPGDLLFTGTPGGVSPLAVDDVVEAGVEGLEPCRFTVGPLLPPTEET